MPEHPEWIEITEERSVGGITSATVTAKFLVRPEDGSASEKRMRKVQEGLDVWEANRRQAEDAERRRVALEQILVDAVGEEPTSATRALFDYLCFFLPEDTRKDFERRMAEIEARRNGASGKPISFVVGGWREDR